MTKGNLGARQLRATNRIRESAEYLLSKMGEPAELPKARGHRKIEYRVLFMLEWAADVLADVVGVGGLVSAKEHSERIEALQAELDGANAALEALKAKGKKKRVRKR